MDSDPAYNTIKSISEVIVKYCKVELTFAWTSNQIGADLGFFLLKSYLFKSGFCFQSASFCFLFVSKR